MAIEETTETEKKVRDICSNLKQIRNEMGLSQRDVAFAMGMAQPNFQRLEAGKYMPKMSTLYIWAQSLGYDIDICLLKDNKATNEALDKMFGPQN